VSVSTHLPFKVIPRDVLQSAERRYFHATHHFVNADNCRPARSYWDSSVPAEWCVNSTAFNLTTAALNSFSDFLVYLWPARYIWHVQLPKSQRLGLIFVFVIGCGSVVGSLSDHILTNAGHAVQVLFVCGSFTKLSTVLRCSVWTPFQFFSISLPWSDDGAAVWASSSVETNVGIIFTCIHAIKPVMMKRKHTTLDSRELGHGLSTIQKESTWQQSYTQRPLATHHSIRRDASVHPWTVHDFREVKLGNVQETEVYGRQVEIIGGNKRRSLGIY